MQTTTFQGEKISTQGNLPAVDQQAPNFNLPDAKGNQHALTDYEKKFVVLNIFPKIKTPVCSASVRKFNQSAADLPNTVVLCISKDSKEDIAEFCAAEGIDNVVTLSAAEDQNFEKEYGVLMTEGPLKGLFARSVVVISPEGKVVYEELLPKIEQEPNYEQALKAAQ